MLPNLGLAKGVNNKHIDKILYLFSNTRKGLLSKGAILPITFTFILIEIPFLSIMNCLWLISVCFEDCTKLWHQEWRKNRGKRLIFSTPDCVSNRAKTIVCSNFYFSFFVFIVCWLNYDLDLLTVYGWDKCGTFSFFVVLSGR